MAQKQGRKWKSIPYKDAFMSHETIGGAEAEEAGLGHLVGKSLLVAYEGLNEDRVKVAHAFLNEEDPIGRYTDILADRLEAAERAATRRAQARYIARRLMRTEFLGGEKSANDRV